MKESKFTFNQRGAKEYVDELSLRYNLVDGFKRAYMEIAICIGKTLCDLLQSKWFC